MKLEKLLFNGKEVDQKELTFKFLRRGFLYGDGVFETILASDFKILRFDEHWERLKKGARICNLEIPDREWIRELIEREIKNLKWKRYYIRINIWRRKPEKFNPEKETKSHFLVIIKKFKPYPKDFYKHGLRCIVSQKVKRNEKSVLSHIKSFNYLENIILKIESGDENCDDAIILNTSGYITCSSVSNIFFVRDNIIFTPSIDCGCLKGITREILFEICKKEKIELKEGFFDLEFLKNSKEIFLTNTLMGVMPVREIKNYFKSENFEFTKSLMEKYKKVVKEEININL